MENYTETELPKKEKNLISEDMHPSDIANALKNKKTKNKNTFYKELNSIPDDILGSVIIELPDKDRNTALEYLDVKRLQIAVTELETDDATDLYQDIEDIDKSKAKKVFDALDFEDKQEINLLKDFDEDQAGAFMQIELFKARENELIKDAIRRLRKMKNTGELENIHQVFIVNEYNKLIGSISLEELITYKFSKTFAEVLKSNKTFNTPKIVQSNMDIKEVVKIFEKYNLTVIPVVDIEGKLLGRITSDDILDVIEENATEQIYNLAGVDDDAESEDLPEIIKKRSLWLLLNLFTAVLASIVIGLFDATIESYVALAILMPIVASMGGNAGTQTLTVVVRQLALGLIDLENGKEAIKKEIIVGIVNGSIFAIVSAGIAYAWFGEYMLGVVIGLSMVINLFSAGLFGSMIPLMLKRMNIDPAIGSTVLLTTVTDVVGFFSFLALAKVILL